MKNQLDEKKIFKKITNVYSNMGVRQKIFGTTSYYYHALYWRNYVLSPYFLSNDQVDSKLLKAIETHFSKQKISSPFDAKLAYINLITNSGKKNPHRDILKSAGWEKQFPERKFILNVWHQPVASQLPKGYSVKVGAYFDPTLQKDLWKVMKQNFPLQDQFQKYLNLWHRKIHKNVQAVVIYDSKKKPAASGLVITGQTGAFLYCGSVNFEHRQKGLWKCLVAIRQSVSHVDEGIWVMLSENKLIRNSGQIWFPMETYCKSPSSIG